MILAKVKEVVGNDLLQIFGPSGSGKSTFAYYIAEEAVELGLKVVYIDTERNLDIKDSTIEYYYIPDFDDVIEFCRRLPKADLYILDSLGFPAVSKLATVGMKEKGDIFLNCINLTHIFKIATQKNKALAIVINQPVSEFARKESEDDLPPFGEKSIYGYKEIWRTYLIRANVNETLCSIKAWRSRKFGRGKELFRVRISNEIKIESLI